MTAFWALTKRIIRNTLVPSFSDAKEKKKYITIIVVLAVCLGIPYIFVLVSAYGLISASVELNYLAEVLSTVFLATQILTIFFGLFIYINVMYYSKDNEFLFTLPIKSVGVFWAKLIAILLHELIISAILILPMSLVVGIAMAKSAAGLSAGFLLLVIPATVLLPLMAILVIAILSYPLMKILNFFKKRPILGAVFVIILVAAFYIAIYLPLLLSSSTPSAGDIEGAVDGSEELNSELSYAQVLPSLSNLGRYSFHTFFLAKAMTSASGLIGFGYAMAFVGIVLALAAVGSLLAVWQYTKLAASALENGGENKKAGKAKEAKAKSCKKALYVKDILSILKNNALLIQSGIMTILPPILIFFICQMQSGIEEIGAFIGVGIAELILKLMLASNVASILAFSRDGEGVFKYKTLPINAKDVVNAKIMTGFTFSAVTTVLTTIALAFVSGINIVFVIGFIASNALYALAMNRFCVYRDLKKPKVHWKNLTEITKNNFSSIIPMFISFIPGLAILAATSVAGIYLKINSYLMGLLYCVIALAVGGIFLLVVKGLSSYDTEEALQRIE